MWHPPPCRSEDRGHKLKRLRSRIDLNPLARSDQDSPIAGTPILDADRARTVMVVKRSMSPGFAGIDNELYLEPQTTMLFGDAKDSVVKLIAAVKQT